MLAARPITPCLGSEVPGLDLRAALPDEVFRAVAELLFARGFLVFRGQQLDNAAYLAFASRFGAPLTFFIPEHRDREYPEVITISNDPATAAELRDGAVHWHSDSSYETVPATFTLLYGVEAPERGGETLFASAAAAWDALPPARQAQLEGLVALHELGRAPWIDGESEPDPNRPRRQTDCPRHPLIARHPVTGRRSIYTSGTAYAIEGMADAEATALIRDLRRHLTQPQFRASHKIMPGDLLIWDNYATVHSATPIAYSAADGERRLLRRISTKGLPAFADPSHR